MTELREVLDSMQARHIALPLSRAMVCQFEDSVPDLIVAMERRQYDACPVLRGGVPVGVFSRLSRPGSVEAGTRPLTVAQLVSGDTPIMELARKLNEHEFIFILSGSQISGFVTVADLGSTPARSFCYLKLASVEIGLSKYLRLRFPEQQSAVRLLAASRQSRHASLVGELKAADQYIDEIAACSLEDLLSIAGKDEAFREALPGISGWTRLRSGLFNFRNDVMHPSRPILSGERRSISQFIRIIENLQEIGHAIDKLLSAHEADGYQGFPD